MDRKNRIANFYQHYRYVHFFSICFGLGWATALYSPYRPVIAPTLVGAGFTFMFESASLLLDVQPHTKACKGPPYDRKDVSVGFFSGVIVGILHYTLYHACPLSCGCGLIMFSFCGSIRKSRSLRRQREGWHPWR